MKQFFSILLGEEPWRSIIYLVSLTLVRADVQIELYRRGFISVAADEFARGVRAATWAENPQFNVLADAQGIWLPLEKYLNGLFLFLWPDVILAPRLTVFIASCLTIVALYLLVYYLFDSFPIAVLSTLFITFQPWYVWLSGTPMLEMYFFACFFAGLLFIILWLKEGRRGCWFWAGLCFLLASGFHVQSWTFINLINLLTLPYLYRFIRQKETANLAKLIVYYVLSNGIIISLALIEFIYTGEIFAFFANHTSYSKRYYDGYTASVLEKVLYYPKLVVQNSSLTIWFGLFIALIFLGQDRQRRWKFFPLLFAVSALLLNSVLNVISVPATAAPGRYALFFVLILSPYVAYGIYHLFVWGRQHSRQLIRVPAIIVAVSLFSSGLLWGAYRIPNYPQGMPLDAVEVGRTLDTLLDKNPGVYMVELHSWEHLAVNLTSRHYDAIIYDREQTYGASDISSIFLAGPTYVCSNVLAIPDLNYVLLKDEDLKLQAASINHLRPYEDIGGWTIYEVVPAAERANIACS